MAKVDSAYCPVCRQQRPIRREQCNHILHLLLTVFTFGLWIIGWLIVAARASSKPARCTFCGTPMRLLWSAEHGHFYTPEQQG